jgi:hypothetical protein
MWNRKMRKNKPAYRRRMKEDTARKKRENKPCNERRERKNMLTRKKKKLLM